MSISRIDKKILDETEVDTLFPILHLPTIIRDYKLQINN